MEGRVRASVGLKWKVGQMSEHVAGPPCQIRLAPNPEAKKLYQRQCLQPAELWKVV